jgi:hypothetical protein
MKLVIAIVLILPSIHTVAQSRVIENKSGGYSIAVPASWTEKTDGTTTDVYPPEEGELDEWTEFIGVSIAGANGLSLDEAFQYYLMEDFPSYYPGFTVVKKGEETIHGQKAKWMLYSFSNAGTSNSSAKEATLYNVFYLFHQHDVLYFINGIAEKSYYPTYEQDFLTVIRSFRLVP